MYETLGVIFSLKGLVHKLLFLNTTHSRRRDGLCSAHQCPHHSSFVGCRIVAVKAQILICVGGLTVHRGADVAIFSAQEDVKKKELSI